jgi:hypothetical protein
MDILKLYQDHGVHYAEEGHRHHRPGWVNVECPFCSGNPGMHLGYNLEGGNFVCFRCGSHSVLLTISKLLGMNSDETKKLLRTYKGHSLTTTAPVKISKKHHKLPSVTASMKTSHRKYLMNRGFDPEQLEKQWGLLGTGPSSMLDGINYKNRILAPIIWDNQQVSFQTRSLKPQDPRKYMACPEERELIKHKHILYGKQASWTSTGIVLEGVTDVWRLGEKTCATLGIKFTSHQVRILSNVFTRIFVIYDPETQAQAQADILTSELMFRGVETQKITLNTDPGDMKQSEANYLIKQLTS